MSVRIFMGGYVDYEGKKKRCFGVFGFEPDTGSEFLTQVERCLGIKLPL
jgi:hypothetical protein